jgi:hypothetical protein
MIYCVKYVKGGGLRKVNSANQSNTIPMKNVKQFFLQSALLLALSALQFNCAKSVDQGTVTTQNLNLSQDSNFIEIVKAEENLFAFILQLSKTKGLSQAALKYTLQNLHDQDEKQHKGDVMVNSFLGKENVAFLQQYAINYANNWQKINTKFTYVSSLAIDEACKNIYAQQSVTPFTKPIGVTPIGTQSIYEINKVADCGWRYYLCMSASLAIGITCHASCIGTTAGLAAPVCVLLCGTIQAAAGVACIDNYCPFPEN